MARQKFIRKILQAFTKKVIGQIDIEVDLDADGQVDSLAMDRLHDAARKLAKTVKAGSKVTITIDFGKDE